MTAIDISTLSAKIPRLDNVTFEKLSRNDDGKACLDTSLSCHSLLAGDFDQVKEDWYNSIYFHQVRSADALYKHQDRYYLVEFKTGKPENLDIHRKLYDSVIGLMEHSVLSLDECRTKLQYIVVSLKYNPYPCHSEMLSHFEDGDAEPWEYEVSKAALKEWPDADIRKLSGFLVEKIYKLSPVDFEKFVANRNWSN